MSNTKTEAKRPPKAIGLAEQLVSQFEDWTLAHLASDELRRLDAENQQLRAQLAKAVASKCELLDALKVLVENGGIGPESMFHDARAAIAKATGEHHD